MSVLYFSIFSTLIFQGSWIFVNAQNCAIPNSITFLDTDDTRRVETAVTGTVIGTVRAFNVLDIQLKNSKNDFIGFSFNESISEIALNLTRPLKNELDDKRAKDIRSSAILTCADGNTKEVDFIVGIKDQNTKCPQFGSLEYNYTIKLPKIESGEKRTDLIINDIPIEISDGDMDFANADIEVTYDESQGVRINTSVYALQIHLGDEDIDEHKFEVTLSLTNALSYKQKGPLIFELKVHNKVDDVVSDCSRDQRTTAIVSITFESEGDVIDPTPEPEPHFGGPPVFTSFYYYAVVKDISKAVKGSFLDDIVQPYPIKADDPDGNHTVAYGILEKRLEGILDIDLFNASLTFNKDLTEEYINGLKDHMEIYRIQAYIAETWKRPIVKFSYVPLVVVYDINPSDNNTQCPDPTEIPTQAPTEIPTQEPTEIPTQEPTEIPTQEPTEFPTGAPTQFPTEEPTTVPPTPTWSSTEAATTGTSSTTTVTTITTEDYGEESEEITESSDFTTEPPTEPEIPTTSNPTSQQTTSYVSTTTEEIPSTTAKPDCPICTTKTDSFRCREEGVFSDPHLCNVFHQCVPNFSKFRLLTFSRYTQRCPPYTGFNETSKSCQYPPKCQCSQTETEEQIQLHYSGKNIFQKLKEKVAREFNPFGYGDDYGPTPEPGTNCTKCTCGVCSHVLPGESVCDGTSMLYPDPHNCKVYHSCRSADDYQGGYIDCLMPCPDNLMFCPIRKVCTWEKDVDCPR